MTNQTLLLQLQQTRLDLAKKNFTSARHTAGPPIPRQKPGAYSALAICQKQPNQRKEEKSDSKSFTPIGEEKNLNAKNSDAQSAPIKMAAFKQRQQTRQSSKHDYKWEIPFGHLLNENDKTNAKLPDRGSAEKLFQLKIMENAKLLTLKQTKEIINELYEGKSKFDFKKNKHVQLETMEMYLYRHLNQKFGLKSLVMEMGVSVWKSVKTHSVEDAEVLLFKKIAGNMLEEGFSEMVSELRQMIEEILENHYKKKFAKKGRQHVVNAVRKVTSGNILFAVAREVLENLIPEGDISIFMEQLRNTSFNNTGTFASMWIPGIKGLIKRRSADKPKECIKFYDFYQAVLRYYILQQERTLSKIREAFAHFDADHSGTINLPTLIQVLSQVEPSWSDEQAESAAMDIDTANCGTVTWSQVATYYLENST